jgi:RNA polymerase sigma factor (sigma-70 family)
MALTPLWPWPIVALVGYFMLHDPKSKPAISELQGNSLLDSLARRYYAALLSFFRKRTHNASDPQDLVQQVFLRLARSRQQGEIHNPDAYIFQTAANTLRDHHRHLAVRNRYLAQVTTDADTSDLSPERIVLAKEDLARLVDGVRQLPERTRDILILRCFEGLKSAEIARLHRISTRAVEKHIAKALAALSIIIDREGR